MSTENSNSPSNDPEEPLPQQENQEDKVFHPSFMSFKEDLETLYIPDNISGRNIFRKSWPDAAKAIFDDELTQHDLEGSVDKEKRHDLENKAEQLQQKITAFLIDIQHNSIDKGSLNVEFLKDIIEQIPDEILECVFTEAVLKTIYPEKACKSGFNLEKKKNLYQVNFRKSNPISYRDLLEATQETPQNLDLPKENQQENQKEESAQSAVLTREEKSYTDYFNERAAGKGILQAG